MEIQFPSYIVLARQRCLLFPTHVASIPSDDTLVSHNNVLYKSAGMISVLTWIAFAVLKRKSGEEYLIFNKFKKFSTAAIM